MSVSNPVTLEDGTEVLFDRTTETTRWTIWRNAETGRLNLAITQKGKFVSVTLDNLRRLLDAVAADKLRDL